MLCGKQKHDHLICIYEFLPSITLTFIIRWQVLEALKGELKLRTTKKNHSYHFAVTCWQFLGYFEGHKMETGTHTWTTTIRSSPSDFGLAEFVNIISMEIHPLKRVQMSQLDFAVRHEFQGKKILIRWTAELVDRPTNTTTKQHILQRSNTGSSMEALGTNTDPKVLPPGLSQPAIGVWGRATSTFPAGAGTPRPKICLWWGTAPCFVLFFHLALSQ